MLAETFLTIVDLEGRVLMPETLISDNVGNVRRAAVPGYLHGQRLARVAAQMLTCMLQLKTFVGPVGRQQTDW
jgi:hypothetical protein